MKKVICLAGPSGSGKTYMRQTDKKLKDLPVVDIADVYRETRLRPPHDWKRALGILLARAREVLRDCEVVVVEAYFSPGSLARDIVTEWAWHNRLKLEWIDLWPTADYKVCRQRVIDSGIEVRERLFVLDKVFGRR